MKHKKTHPDDGVVTVGAFRGVMGVVTFLAVELVVLFHKGLVL